MSGDLLEPPEWRGRYIATSAATLLRNGGELASADAVESLVTQYDDLVLQFEILRDLIQDVERQRSQGAPIEIPKGGK